MKPQRDERGRFVKTDPLIEAEEIGLGRITIGLGLAAVIVVATIFFLASGHG